WCQEIFAESSRERYGPLPLGVRIKARQSEFWNFQACDLWFFGVKPVQATTRRLRSSKSRSRSERNDCSEVSSVSSSALRKLSTAAWKWFSCFSNSPSTAYNR